jgi:diaminopimelate decarboxylase
MNTIYPDTLQANQSGQLVLNDIALSELAKTYGTPLYVFCEETIRQKCRDYIEPLKTLYPDNVVAYAGKACLTVGLINVMADEGMGLDVASGGELYTALKSNMETEKILFHGNNKSISELRLAMQNQIRIVVDNEQELDNISGLTTEGLSAKILLRLKPEIEAHTHDYIKTGQIDSKFGIQKEDLTKIIQKIIQNNKIDFLGLHSHIGSQIFDIQPYKDLAKLMVGHMKSIEADFGIQIKELNLGGGVGVRYTEDDDPPAVSDLLTAMIGSFRQECDDQRIAYPKLYLEPGRSIVANAGMTLYTVGTVKDIPDIKTYLFIDGGMADNLRPLLYQSDYTFAVANKASDSLTKKYAIAGKFCESGDVLATDVALPVTQVGDVLVVFGTGAYNYSMASNYNRFCRPAMIIVNKEGVRILVRREEYDDVIRYDQSY